ncbi:thermopsin precursor, partial [mine drainage metagenome]
FGNSSGFVYISTTHSVSFRVSFYSDQYAITFNEHGLPSGASWNLLLTEQSGNIISLPATSGLLNVPLPNGTYRYSAASASGYLANPALSSFVVNGTSSILTSHNITFVPNALAVTFVEKGLPSGTQWSVTLNGIPKQTDLGSISFFLPGGTYIYHLSSTGTYSPVTSIGVVSVANSNKTVSIQFNSIVSTVSFVASSLPVNTTWSVYVDGQTLVTHNQSMTISLPNGTYQYQVVEQGYYYPGNPYGIFTVSGHSNDITTNFVYIKYLATFHESGLP